MMSENPVVRIQNLTKSYRRGMFRKEVEAVDELSFKISKGSVVGLIGPNGAGKSTTIYCILGMLIPDAGSIEILGEPPQSKKARSRLGFQSEIFHTYEFLKPRAALRFYGRLANMSGTRLEKEIDHQLDRMGLMSAVDQRVGSFSKGMKQRLGIAQALLHDPELLILDEPFTGLDPQGRKLIRDLIFEEKNKGKTIFFSSHILSDIERLCDEVVMIREGKKVLSGDLQDLKAASNRWAITIRGGQELLDKTILDGRWNVTMRDREQGTGIMCTDQDKDELLSRLLESPVEIVDVKRQTRTLEELYMKLEQESS
ncbi:ABC transporter ATP-binding protein [Fodinibius salsisoli]|uniref:ABC transporter ATP-binding protein n=1 Tax=Fodinibius salsisoli TaxID=2820877 RepID=A0ABT3PT40_9BACT|nr:ABC transporter ATP-binding protein [Fodinibius salsisoli]MCW9708992.1 ABC transporter ATP-binding protein [Fodinibius salsisoli]